MSGRLNRYPAKAIVFLITAALLATMGGCPNGDYNPPPSQNLEIWTWYDLDAVRNNLAGNHTLMNDLNSTTPGYEELASPTADWEPIGTFTGTFDGQGHEIKDLFVNRPREYGVGLFGDVGNGGVIKDTAVVNCTVTGHRFVGGLLGTNSGTVSNSCSTGSVSGARGVGGLVGYSQGTVSSSYSTSSVLGSEEVGGLVGENQGAVTSSYSTGHVTGDWFVGGLVAMNLGSVSNCYFTGSVTGIDFVGALVGYGGHWPPANDSYYNYDRVLINGDNIITWGALFDEDFQQWLANDKFVDVSERLSQEDGYYVVSNVTDFKELLAFGQNATLKFRLDDDIDLATEPNFYVPCLAGEFDGNGYKISNLSFNFDFVSSVGLFGYLAPGGNVTNLAAENVNITGERFVGGLVGFSDGTVSNSSSAGSVTGEMHVGGLIGENGGTVRSSSSTGSVTGNEPVGGLVGQNHGTVDSSYSAGSVTGYRYVGGLAGGSDGTVSNSYFGGTVLGTIGVGGLVGFSDGTVSNSSSAGSVTGEMHVGGLIGENGGTVRSSCSTGSVTGNGWVGGLVGQNHGTVDSSYSAGSVTGYDYVGGLVGKHGDGFVIKSYSTASVSGNEHAGGLVGSNVFWPLVRESFWDTETSGQATSAGGTGKNTTEMQDIATFSGAGWSIAAVALNETNPTYIWNIVNNVTYPFLSWQP